MALQVEGRQSNITYILYSFLSLTCLRSLSLFYFFPNLSLVQSWKGLTGIVLIVCVCVCVGDGVKASEGTVEEAKWSLNTQRCPQAAWMLHLPLLLPSTELCHPPSRLRDLHYFCGCVRACVCVNMLQLSCRPNWLILHCSSVLLRPNSFTELRV